MKLKLLIVIILITYLTKISFSQTVMNGRGIELNPEFLKIHESNDEFEIVGTYRFGDSEWESFLTLSWINDQYSGQLEYLGFDETNSNPFFKRFIKLENLKIENGNLYATGWKGKFAYIIDTLPDKPKPEEFKYIEVINSEGIILFETPDNIDFIDKNEFGTKISKRRKLNGSYPEASVRILTKEELSSMSKEELRIMRNEIFARYNYDFKDGGEMEKYFENFSWYKPLNKSVNEYLTEIEIQNIKTILELERNSN